MTNKQQTPWEKLIADKERVSDQCRQHERKLNEDFAYIQENAGSLLLSGLSSLLFPGNKSGGKTKEGSTSVIPAEQAPVSLGIADYLSIAKGMIPIAWDIIQPMLVTWGIQKAKRWISRSLFKKKK